MTNIEKLLKTTQQDKHKTLSREEEVKLGTIIQSSSSTDAAKQKAIQTLVLKNILLVLKLCHKYKRKEFELEDLVGYGILGLFTAARKFDPSRKNRFASYARHWIKESMMKAIREYSGMPKIPVYLVKDLWNITRILSKNDEYNDDQLAELTGIPKNNVTYLRTLLFKSVQFKAEYVEVSPITPEDEYAQKERDKLILTTLKKLLTIDEFEVLAHTCELWGYAKMTFAMLESDLRIKNPRKLKADALKKLSKNNILKILYEEG